jgi:NADPH:quinone reductase-like Zn-dependent oxidoreductase
MRAFEVQGAFGLDRLTLVERPSRKPGPFEVRLRVTAVSLNVRDYMMVAGAYNPRQKLPLVPCSDGVGVVEEVGPGVTKVKVGDRVIPSFFQGWSAGEPTRAKGATALGGPLDGTLAEEMVAREEGLVPAPAYLSDEAAATLPCAALTAWNALVGHGKLKPGETVLVQGTGGVSIFALQIARMCGARVIVTSKSEAKLARAKALGAFAGIDYTAVKEWGAEAKKLAGGAGVDHVVEVGGAGTFEQSLRAVRPGGSIYVIGVLSGAAPAVSLVPILMQNIRVQGILVGHREAFEDMLRAFTAAELQPVVDEVFPFAEAKEAFAAMEKARHFGKIAIRVNP